MNFVLHKSDIPDIGMVMVTVSHPGITFEVIFVDDRVDMCGGVSTIV